MQSIAAKIQTARSKSIRGETYTLTLLSVSESEEALVRLIELLGPAFVDTISSGEVLKLIVGAAQKDREVDAQVLAELAKPLADAARGALSRLRRDDLSYFAGLFKGQTRVGKQELSDIYDLHFIGKMGALREWLLWCLWEHFADFFGGGGAMQSVLAAVRTAGDSGEAQG